MKMSCNGCRVLRKGCTHDCAIRPCLTWIQSPEAQANATLFLAKFYGRAGLLNLISPVSDHLRPEIFRSLLYEACGRIVNPVYGSVGLLWSGHWAQCQAAVDAVLAGSLATVRSDGPQPQANLSLPTYDIRHASKQTNSATALHQVTTRPRLNMQETRPKSPVGSDSGELKKSANMFLPYYPKAYLGDPRKESSGIRRGNGDNRLEEESLFSVETVETSLVNRAKLEPVERGEAELDLELTLGSAR